MLRADASGDNVDLRFASNDALDGGA